MEPSARAGKVAAEPTKSTVTSSSGVSAPGKVVASKRAKGRDTNVKPRLGHSTDRPQQSKPPRQQQPARSTSSSVTATTSTGDGTPVMCRLRRWKEQKQLLKIVDPKHKKAPFRPPSREPSPLPAPPDYASFRKLHRRYYDSIRHTFISNASSAGSCANRHANCKASHAASEHSERPPWDDSTKLSFAPAGFQFLPPVKRTATRAAAKSKTGEDAEDEANIASASGVETAAELEEATRKLFDFSFLFKPYSFSLQSPTKKVNEKKEKASAKKGVLASVGNIGSASQDTKLGGSRRRRLASKENTPAVEPQCSAKSNALSKQKEGVDHVRLTRAPFQKEKRT